ncbi:MAG: T9SS type A sorting domain-containing protein [Ignavibacteria bacterium]|nr:T9SS type A sorting domain-containing protein [Ignavibacteria bacterium]
MIKSSILIYLVSTLLLAGTIPVSFQVNMKNQMYKGKFDLLKDSLFIQGDFQVAAGDTGNWSGRKFRLSDPDNDSIYTATVSFPLTSAGTVFHFNFVKNGTAKENALPRSFTLSGSGTQVLPVCYFSNDSLVPQSVSNTFIFTADMREFYGYGKGFFDPSKDSLLITGLDLNGNGTIISGKRKMSEITSPVHRFRTSVTVKGYFGDSTAWKFKAYPDIDFANAGWESGADRWVVYGQDGSTISVPEIVPNLTCFGTLTADVYVEFNCDMSNQPINRYTNTAINTDSIKFVGIMGSNTTLGSWGGKWTLEDTVGRWRGTSKMKTLTDKPARDKIYRTTILFPKNTPMGDVSYKYGVYYPGVETVNGGVAYLNNEGPDSLSHKFFLLNALTITCNTRFGYYTDYVIHEKTPVTAHEFQLDQNYPNPFNPSTTIQVTLPYDGEASLKIYDVMGREVATLFDGMQKKGNFRIVFTAGNMASGVYFYSLRTHSGTVTKKMMYLK